MANNKILFIGEMDCEYSQQAYLHLTALGYEVQSVLCKGRKNKLPEHALTWMGDYIFSFRSYYIFEASFLEKATIAAINFHPAPPEHPGSGSINWALYKGDTTYGVTVHIMNDKVDNGPILDVCRFPVREEDNVVTLLAKAKQASLDMLKKFSTEIKEKGPEYIEDKLLESRHIEWSGLARRMSEVDGLQRVNINCTKEELDRLARATKIGPYGPQIHLHGYVFSIRDV